MTLILGIKKLTRGRQSVHTLISIGQSVIHSQVQGSKVYLILIIIVSMIIIIIVLVKPCIQMMKGIPSNQKKKMMQGITLEL